MEGRRNRRWADPGHAATPAIRCRRFQVQRVRIRAIPIVPTLQNHVPGHARTRCCCTPAHRDTCRSGWEGTPNRAPHGVWGGRATDVRAGAKREVPAIPCVQPVTVLAAGFVYVACPGESGGVASCAAGVISAGGLARSGGYVGMGKNVGLASGKQESSVGDGPNVFTYSGMRYVPLAERKIRSMTGSNCGRAAVDELSTLGFTIWTRSRSPVTESWIPIQ